MGNEIGTYKNCTLIESNEISHSPFAVYSGFAPDDTDVSVFVYQKDDVGVELIQNAVKHMKTLRHPGIVKLLGVDKSHEETWLITECVQPLEEILEKLSPEEICAGLHDVIQVMAFIHDRAHLSHNSLSISSIFVAEGGAWKIGGLDFARPFDKVTSSDLAEMNKWRSAQCIAPEEKSGFKASSQYGHARDCFAFGNLAEQLLQLITTQDGDMKAFARRLQEECTHNDPRMRPQFTELMDEPFFKSDFVQILNFLRTLTIHTESEKQAFFHSLASRLCKLPAHLVASRLARPLLARFVLLEPSAVENLLPHLLTPCTDEKRNEKFQEGEINPLLPSSLFKKYIIPEIVKILHVRDAHIRIVLLRHFRSYHGLFDTQVLKAVVLPQILIGLRDINDELGELSLRALADLVPILGGSAVISPKRSKLFSTGTPKKFDGNSFTPNGLQKPSPNLSQPPIQNAQEVNVVKAPIKIKDLAREAEREKRREEARRRAEERRLKREQRKNAPVKAQLVEDEEPTVKTIESDDGGPADINKSKSDWSAEDVNHVHSLSDAGSEHSHLSNNDAKHVLETSLDRTESDIDLEIEAELNAMDSTLPKDKQEKLYSERDPELDIHVDWSDIPSQTQNMTNVKSMNKGVLKLKTHSKPKSENSPTERTNGDESESANYKSKAQSGDMEDWSGGWDDIESSSSPRSNAHENKPSAETSSTPNSPYIYNTNDSKPLTVKSAEKQNAVQKSLKGNRQPRGPPKVQDNLGADYDIKSLDVKNFKISNEMDFFADMTPEIEKKKKPIENVLDALAPSKSSYRKEKTEEVKTSTLSFAMQDTADADDAGGWDNDDFDW